MLVLVCSIIWSGCQIWVNDFLTKTFRCLCKNMHVYTELAHGEALLSGKHGNGLLCFCYLVGMKPQTWQQMDVFGEATHCKERDASFAILRSATCQERPEWDDIRSAGNPETELCPDSKVICTRDGCHVGVCSGACSWGLGEREGADWVTFGCFTLEAADTN